MCNKISVILGLSCAIIDIAEGVLGKKKVKNIFGERGFYSMRKNISRFLAAVMASVMVFTAAPALDTQAADKQLDAETLYMTSKDSGYVSFDIDGVTKVNSVKSSNMAVLKPSNYSIHNNKYDYYYYSDSKNAFEKSDYNSGSKYTDFSFRALKKGSSNITIKSGSTTYKKKVNVLNYVNPLKTLTISNVNGGKNIAGKFKAKNYNIVKGTSANQIKVKASTKSGWVIKEIYISNTSYEDGQSEGAYTVRHFRNGVTSSENILNYYDLGHDANVYVYCENKANGGKLSISTRINKTGKE